jgi:hypothetical protein
MRKAKYKTGQLITIETDTYKNKWLHDEYPENSLLQTPGYFASYVYGCLADVTDIVELFENDDDCGVGNFIPVQLPGIVLESFYQPFTEYRSNPDIDLVKGEGFFYVVFFNGLRYGLWECELRAV